MGFLQGIQGWSKINPCHLLHKQNKGNNSYNSYDLNQCRKNVSPTSTFIHDLNKKALINYKGNDFPQFETVSIKEQVQNTLLLICYF